MVLSTVSQLHVIYDGHCGFCVKVLRVFGAIDVGHRLAFHDARHRSTVLAEFPQLRDADLDDAMFAVHGDVVSRGFYAFRQLMWQGPFSWVLIPLFYAPGASFIGPRLYRWIASKRRMLGCEHSCEIPFQR
jgi:predicted DCC family thiol-disulfide oxidoreductase YuxK